MNKPVKIQNVNLTTHLIFLERILSIKYFIKLRKMETKVKWFGPINVLEAVDSWNERDCGMARRECASR